MRDVLDTSRKRFLILGLGNPLAGDDAFGVEVAARLAAGEEVAQVADVAQAGTDLVAWADEFARYGVVVLVDAVLDPERAGQVGVLPERDLASCPDGPFEVHSISPLVAWRLFRTLHPGSRASLWLVAYRTAGIRVGHRTFVQRQVEEAVCLVRGMCLA